VRRIVTYRPTPHRLLNDSLVEQEDDNTWFVMQMLTLSKVISITCVTYPRMYNRQTYYLFISTHLFCTRLYFLEVLDIASYFNIFGAHTPNFAPRPFRIKGRGTVLKMQRLKGVNLQISDPDENVGSK
jgi:hypothetical protein